MMINPLEILLKTATNYVAFKTVKGSVDNLCDQSSSEHQAIKAVQCNFCWNIWGNSPDVCPHCKCPSLKKLYRDFDYRKNDDQFNIDSALTMGSRL